MEEQSPQSGIERWTSERVAVKNDAILPRTHLPQRPAAKYSKNERAPELAQGIFHVMLEDAASSSQQPVRVARKKKPARAKKSSPSQNEGSAVAASTALRAVHHSLRVAWRPRLQRGAPTRSNRARRLRLSSPIERCWMAPARPASG